MINPELLSALMMFAYGIMSVTFIAVGIKILRTPNYIYNRRNKVNFAVDTKTNKWISFNSISEETISDTLS